MRTRACLRAFSTDGTLTDRQVHNAKQEITFAIAFVSWLATRGVNVAACRQADVDAWLATGPTTRSTARTFVVWAANKGLMPKLELHTERRRRRASSPRSSALSSSARW